MSIGKIVLYAVVLFLFGCTDRCPNYQKTAIIEILSCDEATATVQTCLVELANGHRSRVLATPKLGDMICP
jgi:hypothetical protein